MKITIIVVGRTNSDYQDNINNYLKRLSQQTIEWLYISPASNDILKAKELESNLILAKLKPSDVVWLLDETGEQVTSPSLNNKINVLKNSSLQRLVIIIGGAYGVNNQLKQRATWIWSLSKLVFPHELVRLILVEQLYRASQIDRGTGYHHA
jgi:23S rRNA (pseudouridine1915-N3)-methyltransferase